MKESLKTWIQYKLNLVVDGLTHKIFGTKPGIPIKRNCGGAVEMFSGTADNFVNCLASSKSHDSSPFSEFRVEINAWLNLS